MCLACDMEAMWFAVMEARTAAGAESAPQPDEPATLLAPPEEGGGGASAEGVSNEGAPNEGTRQRQRSAPSRRFACEETPAE
jgi:hypothetical protein